MFAYGEGKLNAQGLRSASVAAALPLGGRITVLCPEQTMIVGGGEGKIRVTF